MQLLLDYMRAEREYKGFIEHRRSLLTRKPKPVGVTGLSDGAKYAFYAASIKDLKKCALIIVPDEKDCIRAYNSLSAYGLACGVYPLRDLMLHSVISSHDYEHQRLSVLSGILNGTLDCVIATPDAVMQFTTPKNVLKNNSLTLSLSDTCELSQLCEMLTESGYARVETVDGIGQFSVRGGIVDIFSPGSEYPYRMELFGDEIDSMGIFDILSQRRIESILSLTVLPVREVIADNEGRKKIYSAVEAALKKVKKSDAKKELLTELDALDAGGELLFADKYMSLIYDESTCLLDYFSNESLIFIDGSAGVSARVEAYEKMTENTILGMIESGQILAKYACYGIYGDDLYSLINSKNSVYIDVFVRSGVNFDQTFSFRSSNQPYYSDSMELLCEDVTNYISSNYAVILLCENEATAKNYSKMLDEHSISSLSISSETEEASIDMLYGKCVLVYGSFCPGFILEGVHLACISLCVNQSSYNKKTVRTSSRTKKGSGKERIMSYADLVIGDYVVHDTHGIGLYNGIKSLTDYQGVTKDFLQIEYSEGSLLYVPCDRLDTLSKYIGARMSDGTVKLNKMGGGEWNKSKAKVKAAVREMARELIELYAKRMKTPGFKFSHDDDMQRQFEGAFEYEETECQLEACNDIKRDMQSEHPMDRLLCGDVGFGKTEVALRAAFKAVCDNKQVAILVPTTILAMQHYQTVLSRMRTFPVSVDLLSRFRTQKQQLETLRRLKRGDVDIIIGTHRLISKDVEFKDLGLIIIDEEQRFGVAHKERLKQISKNADVLTLTATPIPRTLNMAISGIRDMSVLDEPPGDRMPPQSYVIEYDELIIAEAIKKELRRGGQVFYLHNEVEDIDLCASKIAKLVPDASISIAHGQMDKEELSDVWQSVVDGRTDILVCTTIIETGIDVPNANTLIIENADKMGLSQLHQIRGRIGRSSRRSYAYFTYRKDKVLTEIAEKRLKALSEYTEFGSGFKIALRDLELRGAGNVLGVQQHGHMESVGYDMYIKLLNEAVLEETGTVETKKSDCSVELNISAYIPEDYITSSSQRIEIYKKISHIITSADADDIASELLDRFGDIPNTACSLIDISYIRSMGCECGIKKIAQNGNTVTFTPEENDLKKLVGLTTESNGRMFIIPGASPTVVYRIKKGDNVLSYIKKALECAVSDRI